MSGGSVNALKIAVIGAGTAGLAAAIFLKRAGHDVTLYEKFDAPKPLGAGLMLQPTGLAVLAQLGLDKAAIAASSPIHHLYGKEIKSGRVIFDITYGDLSPHLFGLGIHRNTLFSLLHGTVIAERIPVTTATAIIDVLYDEQRKPLVTDGSKQFGPYDLVVDAQGTRSQLRDKIAKVKCNKPYPYAAIWGVCTNHDGQFDNTLNQRYRKAHHMIGVLPVGKVSGSDGERVAFFWSLRAHEYQQWRERGIDAWRDYVISLWPDIAPLVNQFRSTDDLNFATYNDIRLRTCHGENVVCIGDAAHATSPQLGQGANLALLDALILSQSISSAASIPEALADYAKRRKAHVRFYQTASGWLTPFFQSDSRLFPIIRDYSFGWMCRLPLLKRQMLRTLAGVKTGLFSVLNPGDIAPAYDLRKRASKAFNE